MNVLLTILGLALTTYLAWAVFYQLTFAVAGHFFKKERLRPKLRKEKTEGKLRRFAVLIPAYKEDSVIGGTVRAALRQKYPEELFDVVLIADSLQPITLWQLRDERVKIVPVEFEKSTKSKSLNAALAQLGEGYDATVILDADNHAHPDFLTHINDTMNKGSLAVQGCRAAKNGGSNFSLLDGASEAVNNHLLCRGHRALGLSARLAGSGMAFEFSLFKKVMKTVDALGGFDKELELKFTQLGVSIAYAPDAIVFDEKIENAQAFARQRGRWLAAQYRYGRRFAGAAMLALVRNGNYDFFNKTMQMALPPRLVLPGVLALGTAAGLAFELEGAWIWATLFAGNMASFALSIPREFWRLEFLKSLASVPLAFISTLRALTLMPLAGKNFLHTAHGSVALSPVKNN